MSTPHHGLCPLAHVNSVRLKDKFKLKDGFSLVVLLPVSACRPDHAPITRVPSSSCVLRSSCIFSLFVSSRSVCDKLLGHNVLALMSHFVSILSLRVRLLSFICRRGHIQFAANNAPASSVVRAVAFCCYRSASADLPAPPCTPLRCVVTPA